MKIIFGVYLVFLSSICYADSLNLEKTILEQSNQEMEVATKKFEDTIEKCNEIANNKDVNLSLFKDVLFDDLKYSLLHLSRKATDNCSLNEWKNYSFALIKFKRVYEQYEKPPPDEVAILSSVHFNVRINMELKVKYQNIPSKYREVLDNIDELKTPFRVTKLVRRLQEAYPNKKLQ